MDTISPCPSSHSCTVSFYLSEFATPLNLFSSLMNWRQIKPLLFHTEEEMSQSLAEEDEGFIFSVCGS